MERYLTIGPHLKLEAERSKTHLSALFFHIFSRAREKIWPPEATGSHKFDTTSQSSCGCQLPFQGSLLCGLFAFPEFAQEGGAEDEGGAGEAGGGEGLILFFFMLTA